jgi:RimJ/RimL family protein N-acetyltransferase
MLTFLPHTRQDVPLRVKWLNNKKANVYAIDSPSMSTTLKKQEEWFDDYENNINKKFFTIYHDSKPIGFMGLTIINKEKKDASLFIMIGEDNFRGKGYGKIALQYLIDYGFNTLGLNRLIAEVNKKNDASIELNKSLHFKIFDEDETELKMCLTREDV